MKKMILTLVMCLSIVCCLCACGSSGNAEAEDATVDKTSKDNYLGKWDTEGYYLLIEEDGTASYRPKTVPNDGNYDMSWSLSKGTIVLDYENGMVTTKITLELSDDGTQLVQTNGKFMKYSGGNETATFTKIEE